MAFESTLDELFRDETIDSSKILHELLSEKGIDLKTHIADPVTFAILESVVNNLEELMLVTKQKKKQLPITNKLLKDMIKQLKKFLVSWNRLSRKEITDTLKATKQDDAGARSLFQRLAGINK